LLKFTKSGYGQKLLEHYGKGREGAGRARGGKEKGMEGEYDQRMFYVKMPQHLVQLIYTNKKRLVHFSCMMTHMKCIYYFCFITLLAYNIIIITLCTTLVS
jgi:hypothetical protein